MDIAELKEMNIAALTQIAKDLKSEPGLANCPMMAPDGCYEQAFIDGAGADVVNGRVYATIVSGQVKFEEFKMVR